MRVEGSYNREHGSRQGEWAAAHSGCGGGDWLYLIIVLDHLQNNSLLLKIQTCYFWPENASLFQPT